MIFPASKHLLALNVRANGRLPPERDAEFAGSQKMPQTFLRWRAIFAQLASEIALFLIAIHEPPLPNPPRKGEGAGRDLWSVPCKANHRPIRFARSAGILARMLRE